MATTPRPGLPAFWTTAIAKALSGDQPCQLAPWLSGHFDLDKRPREDAAALTVWKTNHTAQLNALAQTMRTDGWKCSVERFFKVTGRFAVISGKVDLIAQRPDYRPLILDVKSGTPRDSDITQVMIEMVMIPRAWRSPDMIFDGEVVYETHRVKITPAQAAAVKPRIDALLRTLGSPERPTPSPGQMACRFCDVTTADCQDRFVEGSDPTDATTDLF